MSKLVKFYTRQIIRTPFFWISFLILIVCFLAFGFLCSRIYQPINYIVQFDNYYTYMELFLIPLAFCNATWAALQNSSIERICLYSNVQVSLCKALGIFLSSSLYLLIPTIYVITNSFLEQTGFSYSMEALIYSVARWVGLILVPQCLAILCVYLFNSYAVFIICLPTTVVFSYLNQYLFSWFISPCSQIPSLFNMQRSNLNGFDIDYTGARLDLFLVSKMAYIFVGTLVILSIVWLIKSSKKTVPAIFLAFLILAEGICVQNWLNLYPKNYANDEKLTVIQEEDPVVSVLSYNGEIELSERVYVNCNIGLSTTSQQLIKFRLDECFEIKSVTCGSKNIPYERSGNFITVDFTEQGADASLITMIYSGRVYYESDTHVINIFSTKRSAALPAPFAFLPTVDGDTGVRKYNLLVKSSNTLISNLDVDKVNKNSYSVQGKSSTCSLFSGYFAEYERDGITFYRARYNQSTDYDMVYDQSKKLRYYDLLTQSLVDSQYRTPRKVFLIYSMYGVVGFPIVIDDYVLLNYGYPV